MRHKQAMVPTITFAFLLSAGPQEVESVWLITSLGPEQADA
jgi:hypothetical protein